MSRWSAQQASPTNPPDLITPCDRTRRHFPICRRKKWSRQPLWLPHHWCGILILANIRSPRESFRFLLALGVWVAHNFAIRRPCGDRSLGRTCSFRIGHSLPCLLNDYERIHEPDIGLSVFILIPLACSLIILDNPLKRLFRQSAQELIRWVKGIVRVV
jgi:hypothetical protein